MTYGIIAWGSSKFANKVLIIQKRAIRIIFGLQKKASCVPIFKKHKILTFTSAYILELMKFLLRRTDISSSSDRTSNYTLRARNTFQASEIDKYKLCENGIRSMAMKLYNKLICNAHIMSSIQENKYSLISVIRRFLYDACCYDVSNIIA